MNVGNTSTPEGEVTETSSNSGADTPPAKEGAGTQTEGRVFTQEQVDALLKQRLAEEKRRAQKKAEEDLAREQGEWKTLCETREAEVRDLQERLRQQEVQTLRVQVSHKLGLPPAFQDRLRGETAEELEKDAEGLLAAIRANAPASEPAPNSLPAANPSRTREKVLPPGIVRLEDLKWE